MNGYTRKTTHFSVLFLICTAVFCVLYTFLGEIIYSNLVKNVNSVIFMGIYFGVFSLTLLIGLVVASFLEKQQLDMRGVLLSLGCVAVMTLFGILFEFLYEIGAEEDIVPTQKYVFLIDNSGSMETSDPNQQRVEAIQRILSDKPAQTEYAVYSFADVITRVREMKPVSGTEENFAVAPGGGTPIVQVLKTVQQDFEGGILNTKDSISVILLTDGYATDNGFFGIKINRLLSYFAKKKIPVNTVGLGDVDVNLLTKISEETGGISIMVSEVDMLEEAIKTATVVNASARDLLSVRIGVHPAWLYVIMRIVFILILGCIMIPLKLGIVNNTESQRMVLVITAAGSLLVGIFLEVGLNVIGIPGLLARLIALLLMGITPAYSVKETRIAGYGEDDWGYDSYNDYGSGGMRV